MAERQKTLYVIAGPNGAGKSTFSQRGKVDAPVIDPDAIARQINPSDPQAAAMAAGRQATKETQEHITAGRSFARETTLAGRSALKLMDQAKEAGYRIELHFVGIDGWKRARARIDERVQNGGHDIPTKDLKRRFARSFENLKEAIEKADAGKLYDSTKRYRRTVAETDKGQVRATLKNPPDWAKAVGAEGADASNGQKAERVSKAALAAAQSVKDPEKRAEAEKLASEIAGKAQKVGKAEQASRKAPSKTRGRGQGEDLDR